MSATTIEQLYTEYLQQHENSIKTGDNITELSLLECKDGCDNLKLSEKHHQLEERDGKYDQDLKQEEHDEKYADELFLSDSSSVIGDSELENAEPVTQSPDLKKQSFLGLNLVSSNESPNEIYIRLIHLLSVGGAKVHDCLELIENNYSRLNKDILSEIITTSDQNGNELLQKYVTKRSFENSVDRYLKQYPYENAIVVFKPDSAASEDPETKTSVPKKAVNEAKKADNNEANDIDNDAEDIDEDWGWDDDLDIDNIEVGDTEVHSITKLPVPFIELMKITDISKSERFSQQLFNLLLRNIGFDNLEAMVCIEKYLATTNIDSFINEGLAYFIENYTRSVVDTMLESLANENGNNSDTVRVVSDSIDVLMITDALMAPESLSVEYNRNYLVRFMGILLAEIDTVYSGISLEQNFLIKNHLLECFKKLHCGRDAELLQLLKQL